MKRIAVFLLFASLFTNAFAQTDTAELLPVEVRAVRALEGSPVTRTNISKQELQRLNTGQDLPFLLNRTPSVVVNSDAGNGVGYTGIRIRGTDATRINVTLNGIPFNDAESQGTFFVDLPDFASSVNSIQIQRGVGTSSNGAGAFGASISMSTNEVRKAAYAEFNNNYGSFNTWKNTIKLGSGLLGERFTVDARLSRITSDGYIDRAESDLSSFYFSSAYLMDRGSLRLNAFSGKEKTYQAWYGVSEADLEKNRTANYAGMDKPDAPYENETDNYQQDHYQFFFDHKAGSSLTFNTAMFLVKGKGYYEQYKADESYSDYGMSDRNYNGQIVTGTDLIRQLWLDNDYYGNVFSLQHSTAAKELIFGGAVSRYTGKHYGEVIWASNGMNGNSHLWYDLPADKKDLSFYGKGIFGLNSIVKIFGDLQWRHVNYQIEGFRNNPGIRMENKYNFLNPKAGISVSGNKLRSYISYSIANKEPNRDDFEAGVGEIPKPERLHDIEAGIETRESKFRWAANVYYMKYKDQLVLTGKVNDVGAYTRTNIPHSYRAGIELQAGTDPIKKLSAGANLTLSRDRVKNFTEFIDDYDIGGQKMNSYEESPISFSPAMTGSASLLFKPFAAFEIDITGKYVSRQYLDNTGNESRSLDPFYVQDLRAAWHLKNNPLRNAIIFVNVYNIFNEMYEPNGYTFSYIYSSELVTENYYFPMAGRNLVAGINLSF